MWLWLSGLIIWYRVVCSLLVSYMSFPSPDFPLPTWTSYACVCALHFSPSFDMVSVTHDHLHFSHLQVVCFSRTFPVKHNLTGFVFELYECLWFHNEKIQISPCYCDLPCSFFTASSWQRCCLWKSSVLLQAGDKMTILAIPVQLEMMQIYPNSQFLSAQMSAIFGVEKKKITTFKKGKKKRSVFFFFSLFFDLVKLIWTCEAGHRLSSCRLSKNSYLFTIQGNAGIKVFLCLFLLRQKCFTFE